MCEIESNKVKSLLKKDSVQFLLMLVLTLMTQVVSLIKSSLLASKYGASASIDAYNLLLSLSVFIFSFFATGITTVLIPAYVKKEKDSVINSFLTFIYLAAVAVSGLFLIVRTPIITLISNGNLVFEQTAQSIISVLVFSQFFNTFMGVTTAFLQVEGKYNIPKWATLVTNLLLVFSLFYLDADVYNLSIVTGVVTIINAVIQFYYCVQYGMRFRFNFEFKSSGFCTMMQIYLPTVFSTGLYQFNLLIDSFLSSSAGEGNVTILSHSNAIVGMLNTLVVGNIMIMAYPKLSESLLSSLKEGVERFKNISYFISIMGYIILILFFILGRDVLEFLILRGNFQQDDFEVYYNCVTLYLLGFPINMLRDLVYRFFYAKGDTKSTFYNSIIVSLLNFVLSVALTQIIGFYGIILGTLLSSILSFMMIQWRFSKYYESLGYHFYMRQGLLLVLSASLIFLLYLLEIVYPVTVFGHLFEAVVVSLVYIGFLSGLGYDLRKYIKSMFE